jgi:hypothetical protein
MLRRRRLPRNAAMSKQNHRKIAAECAIAAAATTSSGDREQLLQIQKKHLALAGQRLEAEKETKV